MLCIKSHLSPASSLLLSEMQTLRWFAFRFLFFGLIHSVQLTHVAADCISFAATFYASHKKSLLTHFVAAPLKIVTANAGSRFCFFARLSISLVGADALIGPKALVLLRSFAERRCTERRDLSEGRALRDGQSGKTVAFRRGRRSRRI